MTPTEFLSWLDGFLLGVGRTHVGLNMDLTEIRRKLDSVKDPHAGDSVGESKEEVARKPRISVRQAPMPVHVDNPSFTVKDFTEQVRVMREGEIIPSRTNLKGYY